MKSVTVTDIRKSFSLPDREQQVLEGLSARFDVGKITVVVGRSGCGKTTLLRLLAGLDQPESGEIDIPQGWRRVMLFQEPRLMPWLTAEQNVAAGLRERLPSEKQRQRVCELLDQVQLSDFGARYPAQLSAGMKQRVALARALASRADLLLMDEPFAALDYFTRENMQELLLRLHHTYQKTTVFVTHQLDEAALLGSSVLLLQDGVITDVFDLSSLPYPRNRLSPEVQQIQQQMIAAFRK